MIELISSTSVAGLSPASLERFMLHCDDEQYRRWWPGVHRSFHSTDGRPGRVGSWMWMDEQVGGRRIAMWGVVERIDPGRRLMWRLAWGVRLPVRLILEYAEEPGGVRITHTVRAGWAGIGAALDPLWRLFFDSGFERAMGEHMRTEFHRLPGLIRTDHPANPTD